MLAAPISRAGDDKDASEQLPTSPTSNHKDLRALFAMHDISLMLAWLIGPYSLHVLGVTAHKPWSTVRSIWATVLASCPRLIYVCGGYSDDEARPQTVERLNLQTGAWEQLPPLTPCRGGSAAACLAGKVYVCGGCIDYQLVLKSVVCFDPGTCTWNVVAPMKESRQGAAASVIAGQLHICGGWGVKDQSLSCTEQYDYRRDMWQKSGLSLSEPRAWAAAGSIGDNLYICGGQMGNDPLNSAECLNVASGINQVIPPMAERRSAPAAGVASGCLIVSGGWDQNRRNLRSVERFDPKAGSWDTAAPMLVRRFGAAACAVAKKVYVFGGYEEDDVDACLTSSECYDPSDGSWVRLPPMGHARSGAVAVVGWA